MALIYKTANYLVRGEGIETVNEAVRDFVAAIRANEPGTRAYTVLQSDVNPQRYFHIYAFVDAQAERLHHDSAATKKFTETIQPELVGTVQFGDYHTVATIA